MRKFIWVFIWAGIALAVFAVIYLFYPSAAPAPPAAGETPAPPARGAVDDARILAADSEPGNWLAHGRDYRGHRFSPLTQVNRENVGELGLAWYRDMNTNRTQESTPLVVDGVMYITTSWSRVFAIEVQSGEVLWSFDPQVSGEYARKTCCDVINRGVAVYRGRVYLGALDGRLHALDAATGAKVWEVDTVTDRSRAYSITGAPLAAAGKIYIGNSGSELGTRGYASAYDAETGALVWRFFTVPGNPAEPFEHPEMELAARTWTGEWWDVGGGGNVWHSIVYDPDFHQVYLGTGNGAPWARAIRSPGGGDNLFLASIVAVDADSGRMKWYYQTVPAENWDYTATQDMALADMEVDGQMRKVLLQAPKNGFFYVIDRADGSLLRAHPFAAVTWATHVDLATGRPVENPDLAYLEQARWVLPGPLGAHNWQAMSVDVAAGLVYLPVQQAAFIYSMDREWQDTGGFQRRYGMWNLGVELGELARRIIDNIDEQPEEKGFLKAFDPLTGDERWAVELPHFWNGGVLGTAGGLVFQGDATGHFTAYDKDSGEQLWRFNAYSSILASPVSFMHDGVQYVSIITGSGGGNLFGGEGPGPEVWASARYGNAARLLVFSLGGDETLPPPNLADRSIPAQHLADLDEAVVARGERLYNNHCGFCHGFLVRSGGAIPDLRRMGEATHAAFGRIVLEGLYASNGMAAFADVLDAEEVEAIHQFVRARAEEDRRVALGEKDEPRLTWIGE